MGKPNGIYLHAREASIFSDQLCSQHKLMDRYAVYGLRIVCKFGRLEDIYNFQDGLKYIWWVMLPNKVWVCLINKAFLIFLIAKNKGFIQVDK